MLWLWMTAAHAATLSDLSVGDLVISEIHHSPENATTYQGQWFEVYNASGLEVDLDGLQIGDGGSQSFTVSGTFTVASGEHVVFATRANSAINGGLPVVDYVYSTANYSLPLGNETLILEFSGTTFDSVDFSAVGFPDPYGASISLEPTTLDATSNDTGSNWCPAANTYGDGDYGSPGSANDSCPVDLSSLISGDLVVTEVMHDPSASAYNRGEWFEIYNASGIYIDVDGLTVTSGTGESMTVSGELLMRPGDYLLVAARSNPAVNGGLPEVDYRYIYGAELILRTTDTLELSDGASTVFDNISWNPTDYPGGGGLAVQLNSDFNNATDNDTAGNWCEASAPYGDGDYGSPGAANTDCDPDSDGDGYNEDVDCDDNDAAVNPGATEICDGLDNDCDALVDNEPSDGTIYYADLDDDKFGDADNTQNACSRPIGYRTNSTDCDDADAGVNPAAVETCDGVDTNCSGDENDASDASLWYTDTDGDGYGDPGTETAACSQPSGTIADGNDCNDGDININPAATETCDGVDDNCSGDENDATDASTWYADIDDDKFGDPDNTQVACSRPSGYRPNNTDCDDANAAINPGATDLCDGIDDNCSGDESDAGDASTWYADTDGDTYGDTFSFVSECSQPSGYIADGSDCDDGNAAINPAATETCDGTDDNCSGDENDATDATTYYADIDDDKYGDPDNTQNACSRPSGYRPNDLDCDDSDVNINPGAEDICNDGIDQDCDGADYGTCDATLDVADGIFRGISAGDNFGGGVPIGDIDGDGNADFATAAGTADEVYIFNGASDWSGETSASDASIILSGAAGLGGDALRTGSQDVDGDGFDDILVSSTTLSTNGTNAGGGYIVYGPLTADLDLTTSADVTVLGDNAEDTAGRAFLVIGDVNGDSIDDMLIAAQGEDTAGTDAGAAYVLFGPTTGGNLSTAADAIYTGVGTKDYFGRSADVVGDVDGDGAVDLLINAYRADRTVSGTTTLNVGASYLLTGVTTGTQDIASAATAIVYGENERDQTGNFIAGAGDLDGDGYEDILLGTHYADPGGLTDAGETYLLMGPLTGEISVTDADARFPGLVAGDNSGRSADGLGDINGDGQGDIVIGAKSTDDNGTDSGSAYIFLGPFSGSISLDQAETIFAGEGAGDRAGISVNQIPDQDGGGQDDLLIGATMNSTAGTEAGASYIIFTERW